MIWTRLMTSGLVCRRVGDEPEPEAVDAIAEGREVIPPRVPGVRVFGDRDLEPDRAEWDVELADGRHAEDLGREQPGGMCTANVRGSGSPSRTAVWADAATSTPVIDRWTVRREPRGICLVSVLKPTETVIDAAQRVATGRHLPRRRPRAGA